MDTEALALARTRSARNLPERLSYGHVELSVTNLDRAVGFWSSVLGLVPRPEPGPGIALGTARCTLVVLHAGATAPAAKGHIGMYHVAFGLPTQAEFSLMMLRLRQLGVIHAPVDHLMSKAIYLSDPDGHGIEIALETPERFGRFVEDGSGIAMLDAKGQRHSGREALDIGAELAFARTTSIAAPVDEAVVAHLHLHVRDLESAQAWFERIGFVRNLNLSMIGFADMGAGAFYTHRLALNLWAGPHAKPATAGMARLLRYRLETTDADVFERAQSLLTSATGHEVLSGSDPAGITLELAMHKEARSREQAA